jgi:UDP-N-acetylmuramate--alanine ligase
VGIGGIGMSGLAEILHSLGCTVKGSDKIRSPNLERLEKLGIKIFIGHSESNVVDSDIVVYSSAIKEDNSELTYAKHHKIPILARAEMLSQIVRFKKSVIIAGSHGKTTVTSLSAALLEMANFNPTVVNGGIINAYQTNAKLGKGDWAVVESDESDGSFVHFFPTIGIITNIDYEHINHYTSFDNLRAAFGNFIGNIPFYGCCIACIDDLNVSELISNIYDKKIITYGIKSNKAMYKGVNIRKTDSESIFDVEIQDRKTITDINIPLLGDHNIKNSLSVIAMAKEIGIDDDEIIRSTLAGFTGVKRRFTHVGDINGVKIIDDYAHHPTELIAVLNAAYQATNGHVAIICQPHRFTRLNSLFNEFVSILQKSDIRIITPVYKADDTEIGHLNSDDLYEAISKTTRKETTFFANDEYDLENIILSLINAKKLTKGDIILFTGAGSISKWAYDIVSKNGNKCAS